MRAVKDLSGAIMGGRQIRVALVDADTYEQKEMAVADLADELRIAIVSMYAPTRLVSLTTNRAQTPRTYTTPISEPRSSMSANSSKVARISLFSRRANQSRSIVRQKRMRDRLRTRRSGSWWRVGERMGAMREVSIRVCDWPR